MKQLIPRSKNAFGLLAVLVAGCVGFGTWYQLSSRADDSSGTKVQVVDARQDIEGAIRKACEDAGKKLSGEVNDLRVEGVFAQATAVCRAGSETSMRPMYFTLKFAGNIWGMLQQGEEPPLVSSLPDPQLPLQFAHGE